MLRFIRRYTTTHIPFDKKPFPFKRFEACCPESGSETASNGFVPCQQHPIPPALGKKVDTKEPMSRPMGLRHIVGCIGYDAVEWTSGHCEWMPGIMQTINNTKQQQNLVDNKQVLMTVTEKPPISKNPDILLFPEFKIIPAIDISHELITEQSPLYPVLHSIWKEPAQNLPSLDEWKDIQADTVVLVCTHARRDMRCGYLGPPIVQEFNKQAKELGLKLEAWGTSHFGGHKFAGNVIIHQRGLGGHAYGNVRACHVKDIIRRHVIRGKVIKELWRGQVTPPSL